MLTFLYLLLSFFLFSGGTNLKSHPVEKVTKLCGSPGLMRLGPQIFVNGKLPRERPMDFYIETQEYANTNT